MECIALVWLLVVGMRRWPFPAGYFRSAGSLIREEMFPSVGIAVAWAVMAILVGGGWHTPDIHTPSAGLIGWTNGGLPILADTHAILPLNAPALFYHTARFGLPPEACGFGLMAHMAVGFSTYALARRYVWPPMALTITLMVLSMPRLVFLGSAPVRRVDIRSCRCSLCNASCIGRWSNIRRGICAFS